MGVTRGALGEGEVEVEIERWPPLGVEPPDPVAPPPTEGVPAPAAEKVAGATLTVPTLPPLLGEGGVEGVQPFKDLLSPTDLV